MVKRSVLIIAEPDDVPQTAIDSFRRLGCDVAVSHCGEEGMKAAASALPDFVLLADRLPDIEPLDVCWRLRNSLPEESAPVFLLAHRGGNGDAASHGEPAIRALCLRMIRFLDDLGPDHDLPDHIDHLGLEIDRRRHRATIDARELKLTPTEFRLLWRLAAQPGYVLDRTKLTETCIGPGAAVQERTIDAHIKSIRHKLCERADLIETVRGVGYRLHEEPVRVGE